MKSESCAREITGSGLFSFGDVPATASPGRNDLLVRGSKAVRSLLGPKGCSTPSTSAGPAPSGREPVYTKLDQIKNN